MGSWNDEQAARVKISGDPIILAAIVLRLLFPHPLFPPVNVLHPFGENPWSAIVGDGQVIMENYAKDIVAKDASLSKRFNDIVCIDRVVNGVARFGEEYDVDEFEPRTTRINADDLQFENFEELPGVEKEMADKIVTEIYRSNTFFSHWHRLSKHLNKGWHHEDTESFNICMTEYELGGDVLIFTVKTIFCCVPNAHFLAYHIASTYWDDDDDVTVLVVADVHDHLKTDKISDYAVLHSRWTNDTIFYHSPLYCPLYGDVDDFESLKSGDEIGFFYRLCAYPDSFSGMDVDVYELMFGRLQRVVWSHAVNDATRLEARSDSENTWTELRVKRNVVIHKIRRLQKAVRRMLYNPTNGVGMLKEKPRIGESSGKRLRSV